ncbi:stage II sporulation protein D [Christensenella sp. MSJ-20]|uniref:stage II sporulation protein D n=1 Tax=Christensenella sp. MSJ-20 TaxID=2841518 RepID=UPI000D7AE7B2|nr:MAG: stage II sporulation protein D [Bacillota bacterium]QWT55036.1 stage II sporulation protein D [Christensenella sp. MSJ-20]
MSSCKRRRRRRTGRTRPRRTTARVRHITPGGRSRWLDLLVVVLTLVLLAVPAWDMAAPLRQDGEPWPQSTSPQEGVDLTDYEPVTVRVYNHTTGATESMDFEEYIVGVVSGEMPASYEMEALKAQAVAARTYAYRKVLAGGCGRGDADVCTDFAHCQAYCTPEQRMSKWGDGFSAYEDKLRQAVMGTRGQILAYEGEPIAAFFHAVAGGQTEDVVNVWGGNLPYLKSVESAGEETANRFTRTMTFTYDEFRKTIQKKYPNANLSDVPSAIGSDTRTEAGRVRAIVIGGESISGTEMRSLFNLDSANFTIACKDGTVTITTKGYGHGVGMSQVGALAMAKNGSDYKEILLHYYTGVELTTIKNLK